MTAYADLPLAVQAIKLGAFDFVTKPWDNARLVAPARRRCGTAPDASVQEPAGAPHPCPPARSPRKARRC